MNTEEQLIADLKAKHGRIFTVIVPLDDEDDGKKATYYLKRPDEMTRKMIGKLADKDVRKAVIAGFNALRVAGDEVNVMENNFDAILSAQEALVQILEVQKATIKKKLEKYRELLKADEVAQNDALIRFFYKVNPETLSDTKWCKYAEEINWVLNYTGQLVDKTKVDG